jgi:hypothetical protein
LNSLLVQGKEELVVVAAKSWEAVKILKKLVGNLTDKLQQLTSWDMK